MNSIGQFIREQRKKINLSSRCLADKVGISSTEMMKIENGERETPSPITLKAIANVLNINQIEMFVKAGYLDETCLLPLELKFPNVISDEKLCIIQAFIDFLVSRREKEEDSK